MKKFKNDYFKYFSQLKIDGEKKSDIKNKTKNNSNKSFSINNYLKYATVLLFCICGTVFAFDKIQKFNGLNVEIKDGKPYINASRIIEIDDSKDFEEYNCKLEQCKNEFNISEIEKKVGVKILKDKAISDSNIYTSLIEKKDGKISRLYFVINDIEYKDFYLRRFTFSARTRHFKNVDSELPYSNKFKTIYIEKIDTNILIAEDSEKSTRITFEYKNVYYDILITFKSKDSSKNNILEKYINSLIN